MPRIYTRTGDDGTTSLGTRERVSKDSHRVHAYGEIDELNSQIGFAISLDLEPDVEEQLKRIQGELFDLGTDLAFPNMDKENESLPRIGKRHTVQLERNIDEMNRILNPLKNFILPGGSPGASALHIARAVCRRAERAIVLLGNIEPVNAEILIYINRLSDALFVMARYENHQKDVPDTLWEPVHE